MDFEKYRKEFYKQSNRFRLEDVLNHYELPNSEELHSMICEYGGAFEDKILFDAAESIDYLKYEKELWNLGN